MGHLYGVSLFLLEKPMEDILKAELLAGHPLTGEYSDDPAIACEQINAKNISKYEPISSASLIAWAATGPRVSIMDAADDLNSPVRAAAIAALDLIAHSSAYLDLNLAGHVALLGALENAGVLEADETAELFEMSHKEISRAEDLGLSRVRPGTIERAML